MQIELAVAAPYRKKNVDPERYSAHSMYSISRDNEFDLIIIISFVNHLVANTRRIKLTNRNAKEGKLWFGNEFS